MSYCDNIYHSIHILVLSLSSESCFHMFLPICYHYTTLLSLQNNTRTNETTREEQERTSSADDRGCRQEVGYIRHHLDRFVGNISSWIGV